MAEAYKSGMYTPQQSPRIHIAKHRSHTRSESITSTSSPSYMSMHTPSTRHGHGLSRRSSQSSIRTVATSQTNYSSTTNTSWCSAKFERAYASQSQMWSAAAPAIIRHPSISSQCSLYSFRVVPPHVVGKRQLLQKQLQVVEQLIKTMPDLNSTTTGSVGWLLAHERHLLNIAIKYDERALSEWEAAQDWNHSAHEGPVSRIFVTQPSRFGLTPEQHQYRLGQARKLASNALDLWRFCDLNYQDSFQIRNTREKLQADVQDVTTTTTTNDNNGKKDFQTWLKEVSKTDEASVIVQDNGTLIRPTKVNNHVPEALPK